MPGPPSTSTLRSIRIPHALDREVSSQVAQTGRSRTEVMVEMMGSTGAEVDWEVFDRAVMRHSNAMSTRNALREARAELGL